MSASTRYNKHELPEPQHQRPHNVNSTISSARVILAVKNFTSIPGVCHIGLGVTATNTLKVLRRHGVRVEAWALQTKRGDPNFEFNELFRRLEEQEKSSCKAGVPVSHVVVSAPSWIQPDQFGTLCHRFPEIEFVQLNHSGTSYLSIDKFGIRNIRECIDLELATHNMRVAGNNPRFTNWASDAFGFKALLLPNLYDTDSFVNPIPPRKLGGTLRIGSFGASRPWKNQLTAAEAGVQLARRLGVKLEFFVNSKRPDGGERMIESRMELFHNLPGCKLIKVPWARWPRFRDITATMHILFQPSFDETFNVVTADGIAEGVPSVTDSSIEWTPQSWWCHPEDPSSLVQVGLNLLHDQNSVHEARNLLTHFVNSGVGRWLDFILHREQV